MIKSKTRIGVIATLAYLGIFLLFYLWGAPIDYLEELTRNNVFWGPFAIIFLAFLFVIVAPLTIVPLIPVASVIFGPFLAGLYTLTGWTLGSITAFMLARKYGRPLLKNIVSLKTLEKYENYIPERMEFWWLLLLRFVVSLDIISYALGLFSRVSLWKYSLATLLAFAPYVFIISYAGEAFLMRDFKLFIILAIILGALFMFLSYLFYRKGGVKEEIKGEVYEEEKANL